MIAIGIRYLCGYAVATDPANREQAEWPPHPGRVFMALAAAHFENSEELAEGVQVEREALEWLESQDPPAMKASDAQPREAVTYYVPVNDVELSDQLRRNLAKPDFEPSKADVGKGVSLLPERRRKQPRTYPRVWPQSDTVYLLWKADPPEQVRNALATLCAKVTRIGHSSSLVQAWVVEAGREPTADWLPTEALPQRSLRITWAGCLASLEDSYGQRARDEYAALEAELAQTRNRNRKREIRERLAEQFGSQAPEPRRPHLGRWQGYVRAAAPRGDEPIAEGVFEPQLLIFAKEEGASLGLESTLQVTGALRDAAIKASPQPVPEWLCGHGLGPNGPPSQRPHLAFLPLPFVGHEHADGHLLGLAVAVPRGLPPQELRNSLGPLLFDPQSGVPRSITLWRRNGSGKEIWRWMLGRETRESPPFALRQETWTEPSRVWASVTPVVLHHHPRNGRPDHIQEIVRDACRTAQLPEPARVAVSPISWHRHKGAAHARQMPLLEDQGNGLCRYQVHVMIEFVEPVSGPMLLGRGRYRGYGLCRPLRKGGA